MDSNFFGHYLAALRRKKRLRQKQVAASANLDPSYVAALESGRRVPPREDVMIKLFEALDLEDVEKVELHRSAVLSQVGRTMLQHVNDLGGISTALTLLEISPYLSQDELRAIETLIEGYRFRAHLHGGLTM